MKKRPLLKPTSDLREESIDQSQIRFRLTFIKLFEREISGTAKMVKRISKRDASVTMLLLLITVLAAPPASISALLLLLLRLWWINAVPDELDTQGIFPATTLMSAEEIIRQLHEESESTSTSSGGRGQKPSLKEEIEAAKHRLSHSDYRKARSLYKQLVNHAKKLQQYRQNPLKYDNNNFLKNATSEEMKQKIMQTRIANLERQIEGFYKEIMKLIK